MIFVLRLVIVGLLLPLSAWGSEEDVAILRIAGGIYAHSQLAPVVCDSPEELFVAIFDQKKLDNSNNNDKAETKLCYDEIMHLFSNNKQAMTEVPNKHENLLNKTLIDVHNLLRTRYQHNKTAVSGLLLYVNKKDPFRVVFSSVGNIRGVLYDKKGNVIKATKDHVYCNNKELKRIHDAGGKFVYSFNNELCVENTGCPLTRALGLDLPLIESAPQNWIVDLAQPGSYKIVAGTNGLWNQVGGNAGAAELLKKDQQTLQTKYNKIKIISYQELGIGDNCEKQVVEASNLSKAALKKRKTDLSVLVIDLQRNALAPKKSFIITPQVWYYLKCFGAGMAVGLFYAILFTLEEKWQFAKLSSMNH